MSGPDVSYLAAFGGGLVSFASPCVLPLVPAYLSMVTGLEVSEIRAPTRRHLGRITRDTGLFVGGFSTIFVLLGLTATGIGRFLEHHQPVLTRVSGLLVLAFALFLLGSMVLQAPWLYGEKRFHPRLAGLGPFAAPIAGAAFAFGWTPCLGPVLGSVLTVASIQQDTVRGAALLAAYSLGLGVPFLVTGLAFGRLTRVFGWVNRHYTAITMLSAISLGFFGVLLVLNRLSWVTAQLIAGLNSLGLGDLTRLG